MSLSALLPANAAADFELLVLPAADFPTWLTTAPQPVQDFLGRSKFKADPGAQSWLPSTTPLPQLLLIAAPEPLKALADLPLKLPEGRYQLSAPWQDAALYQALLGWGLGAYKFTRYRQQARNPAQLVLPARADLTQLQAELDAIYLTRDLINTPTNDMLPEQLEAAAQALATEFGARCSSITGDALLQQNFPTIHAVGRASASAPRLIQLHWGKAEHPLVCILGKGVCFDSGGLNIKPASGMRYMKKDMGGAAHALGLARLIMSTQLPIQLQVLIPAVENAIAANAFRPGDIIRTRSGTTVEIDNTDAEGRLVLCDALALASAAKPALMLDFATLTGAARSALGTELPALFCNNDTLAQALLDAAQSCADPIWRMPLHQPYKKMLDSSAADLANSAASPYAGAITAALFLEHFVAAGIPWAHFDLMAWNLSNQPGRPEGGEAMALRASFHMLQKLAAQRFVSLQAVTA